MITKKYNLILLFFISLSSAMFGQQISIHFVSGYLWESSAYTLTGERDNFTYYFDFQQKSQTVEIKELNSNQELIWEKVYHYQNFFTEQPLHIRIYTSTPDRPSFVIMNDENNEMKVSSPALMTTTFESFQTVKAKYVENTIIGRLNSDKVRVRTAPNLDGIQIGSLREGEKVRILNESDGKMKIGEMDSVWYKVQAEDGSIGWSYGAFIDLIDDK